MTYTTLDIERGGACYYQGSLFTGSSTTYVYKANVEGYTWVEVTSGVSSLGVVDITLFSSDSVFDETTAIYHARPSVFDAEYTDRLAVPSTAKVVCFGWNVALNTAKSAVGLKYESD